MLHNYESTENYLKNELQVNAMHLKQLNRDYDESNCLIEKTEIKMNLSLAEEERRRISLILDVEENINNFLLNKKIINIQINKRAIIVTYERD